MAATTLPKPGKIVNGEEIGPCKDACLHQDCADTRRMAQRICRVCGKRIGYETRFYDRGDFNYVHAVCVESMWYERRSA